MLFRYSSLVLIQLLIFTLEGCSNISGLAFATYTTHKKEISNITSKQTESDIKNILGEPNRVYNVKKCKVFEYHDGLSWSGLGFFAISLPLPLLVPSGIDETHIYFQEGYYIKGIEELGEMNTPYGFLCVDGNCGFNLSSTEYKGKEDIEDWCN